MAAAGATVGAVSVVTHGRTAGLVLGVLATSAAAWAVPAGWRTRFAFTAGWTAVLVYLVLPRPGGGYLVSADARGYALLGFGVVVLLFGIVTAAPAARRAPRPDP